MANTSHIGLAKPAGTDHALISVLNNNSDIIDSAFNSTRGDIGIVEDGTTATHAIASGQYVIWQGALYKASAAIAIGTTLSTSNLTAVSGGAANSLQTQVTTLSDHIAMSSISSLPARYPTSGTDSRIKSTHRVVNSVLSNPAAMLSDWTVTTYDGYLQITGTISGTTNIDLDLMSVV